MIGFCPTFYLFHLTADLMNAVQKGKSPQNETIVERFVLRDQIFPNLIRSGIDSRIFICQCMCAFKKYLDNDSDEYMNKKRKLIQILKIVK